MASVVLADEEVFARVLPQPRVVDAACSKLVSSEIGLGCDNKRSVQQSVGYLSLNVSFGVIGKIISPSLNRAIDSKASIVERSSSFDAICSRADDQMRDKYWVVPAPHARAMNE